MQVADAEIDALWLYQVSELDTGNLHQWGVGGGKRNQGTFTRCVAAATNPPPPRTEKNSTSAPPIMVFPGSATVLVTR